MAIPRLILYSRRGCHLCEDFEQALQRQQALWRFEVELRDVDTETAWCQAYGDKVPLLLGLPAAPDAPGAPRKETEISRYFLDLERLRRYLGPA